MRTSRVARGPRATVLNPLTGRDIFVGGRVFGELMQTHDLVDGELVLRRIIPEDLNAFQIMVTEVLDPSTGELLPRASRTSMIGRGAAAALNAVAFRGAPWRILDTFFMFPVSVAITQFRVQHVNGVIATLRRNVADPDGPAIEVTIVEPGGEDGPPDGQLQLDNPKHLPFTNVERNAGDDAACVERVVGFPCGTTVAQIIDGCTARGVAVQILDVFGKVMGQTDGADKKRKNVKIGVMFSGHLYKLVMDGTVRTPRLPEGVPRIVEEEFPEMVGFNMYDPDRAFLEILDLSHSAYFATNGRLYVCNEDDDSYNGAWVMRAGSMEEWMVPLIDMPEKYGWDMETLESIRSTTNLLHYASPTYPKIGQAFDYRQFTTIDMSKAYHTVMLMMARGEAPIHQPAPCIFDQWKPWDGNIETDIRANGWYRIRGKLPWGFLANILPGPTVAMLSFKLGHHCDISHEVLFNEDSSFGKTANVALLEALTPEQQKKCAIIAGIWCIVDRNTKARIRLEGTVDETEAEWYEREHGCSVMGPWLTSQTTKVSARNRHWAYATVVHNCNFLVLRNMARIRERFNVLPVKITVDSLTYRRHNNGPWGPGDMQDALSTMLSYNWLGTRVTWKFERPKPLVAGYNNYYEFREPVILVAPGNRTFAGPPGSGKTTRIHNMHRSGEIKLDFQCCATNRGAARLREGLPEVESSTIHSLFNINPALRYARQNKKNDRLRGALVMVDEAQSVSRSIWLALQYAYEEYGTRFIMSCDPNQVGPIDDPQPVPLVGFFGLVEYLTHDYRNSKELIQARSDLLECKLRVEHTPNNEGPYALTNIAYFNSTCAAVNRRVVAQLDIQPGDGGKYVFNDKAELKDGTRVHNGTVMKLNTPDGLQVPRDELLRMFNKKVSLRRGRDGAPPRHQPNLLEWGYCCTIHKQIGETIEEAFDIWDWADDINRPNYVAVKYTALTRARRLEQIRFRSGEADARFRMAPMAPR